ncbi:hypothetical protein ACFQX6_56305 [Streptosporangium lutulentum]
MGPRQAGGAGETLGTVRHSRAGSPAPDNDRRCPRHGTRARPGRGSRRDPRRGRSAIRVRARPTQAGRRGAGHHSDGLEGTNRTAHAWDGKGRLVAQAARIATVRTPE